MADNAPLPDPHPGCVIVCGLSQARKQKRRFDAVLTLEDPMCRTGDKLRFTAKPIPPHLILSLEDADSDEFGYATARPEQVEAIIRFGRESLQRSLLVHCFHGVGRSAAAALAIIADRMGPGAEQAAVRTLLAGRPSATPNLVMTAHADALLGRNGALIGALLSSEAADPAKTQARARRHRFAVENPDLYAKRTF